MAVLSYIRLKEWADMIQRGIAGSSTEEASRHVDLEWGKEMFQLCLANNTVPHFIVDFLLLCYLFTFGLEFFLNLIAWNSLATVIAILNEGDIQPELVEASFPVYIVLFHFYKVLRKRWLINRVPEEHGQENDDLPGPSDESGLPHSPVPGLSTTLDGDYWTNLSPRRQRQTDKKLNSNPSVLVKKLSPPKSRSGIKRRQLEI